MNHQILSRISKLHGVGRHLTAVAALLLLSASAAIAQDTAPLGANGLGYIATPTPEGKPQPLRSLDETPEGLNKSDWQSIRAAYDAGRHAFLPVEGKDGHWQASNPGQQWTTHFDGRGFIAQPKGAGWQWGLELQSYGFGDQQTTIQGKPAVKTAGQRLSYQWDATVQEWFVNDQRGLEHGFTVKERPVNISNPNSQFSNPLSFTLTTRDGLTPHITAGSVQFQDASGTTVLNYSGLKVWDADGTILPARFEPAGLQGFRLLVDEAAARYPITIDPIAQQAYLKASNTEASDQFGGSVAISGDTAVVGAPFEDSSTTGINSTPNELAIDSGAAYVFVRSGGTWTQQAYLKAAQVTVGDNFGSSVAVSGDTVVIGAVLEDSNTTGINGTPNESGPNTGAAYVFVRSGGTWSQQAYLKASHQTPDDQFGGAVAISGDTVIVGAVSEDSSTTGVNSTPNEGAITSGAAFVFVRSGSTWSQQAYLKASNTGAVDQFGVSVAASGDTVVVGAFLEDSSTTGINSTPNDSASAAGAAYVFVRSGSTWSQQAYLKAAQVTATDIFGISVAASGDTVVVGASLEDSSTTGINSTPNESAADAGAAYVFVRSGSTWSQQAYLKAAQVTGADYFGTSVAVSGNVLVVGSKFEDSSTTGINSTPNESAADSGAAYVFVRSGSTWTQDVYLKAAQVTANDEFGTAVAASGDTVIVGGVNEDSSTTGVNSTPNELASGSGAAYTFTGLGPVVAAPTVASIAPASGSTAGGTSVTITGTGFTGATGVTFGGAAATSLNVVSPTSITCTTPAGTAGTASVVVTTPGGGNAANMLFTYNPPIPTLSAVNPQVGPPAGGTSVTLTGTNFTGATGVTFGGATATSVDVVNDTTITCVSPAGTVGTSSVIITTPSGTNTANTRFIYTGPPTITAGAAEEVGAYSAIPRAPLSTNGLETTIYIELGTTTAYGTTLPVPGSPLHPLSSSVRPYGLATGLIPGTLYHYRLVATNSAGTTMGDDQTFTTDVASSVKTWSTAASTGEPASETNSWNRVANWVGGATPTASQDALLNQTGAYPVTRNASSTGRSFHVSAGTVTLDITGTATIFTSPSAINGANVILRGSGGIRAFGGLTVVNGSLDWQSSTTSTSSTVGIYVGNGGLVTVQAGRTFNFNGTMVDNGGRFVLRGAFTSSSNPLHIMPGGLLTGDGSVSSRDLLNRGVVSPDSATGPTGIITTALTSNASYVQTADGELIVDLGGTTQGTGYDAIRGNGTSFSSPTLAGMLTVRFSGGFIPAPTDVFSIVDNVAGATGTFDTVVWPTGYTGTVLYNGTSVQLTDIGPLGPEINVRGNSTDIVDGSTTPSNTDHTQFLSTLIAASSTRVFTIQNTGSATLNISGITFSGTHAADFSLTTSAPTSVSAGSSVNITAQFSPSAVGTRTATLNIASDDSDEGTYTFAIQGTGANNFPTISKSPFGNETVNEDTSTATLTFTVGDVETPANSLIMIAAPSDTTLVPVANVVFGGSGATRTAVITPAANLSGTTTVSIYVEDQLGTRGGSAFSLTVNPVNDVPSFTKGADQSHPIGTNTAQSIINWAAALSTGPANESTQSLSFNVTEVGSSGIFTTAPAIASNGTLTYRPNGTAGTATFSVTAQDSGGIANGGVDTSAAQTFTITVDAAPDYAITTAAGVLTITDTAGNGDTLALSQPSAGNILFSATGRTFSLNGAANTTNNSGNVSLSGITSVVVNAAAGADAITVSAFSGSFPALTVNGGAGDDTITFNGDITFAAGANLNVDLQDDDAVPGTDSITFVNSTDLSLSGTGSATLKASRSVTLGAASTLDTVNGALTIEANQQAVPTTGTFAGIGTAAGSSIRATGTGVVSLRGKGGDSGIGSFGITLSGTLSGGTAGTLTVQGTGGANTTNGAARGLQCNSATITSLGANVSVIGTAGGSGASSDHFGIMLLSSTITSASATASVTITGTGGTSTGNGLRGISSTGGSNITSAGGNVIVIGTGGTNGNGTCVGVYVSDMTISAGGSGSVQVTGTGGSAVGVGNAGVTLEAGGTITSTAGNVQVTGHGGEASNSNGIRLNHATALISSGGGNVTLDCTMVSTGSDGFFMNAGSVTTATNGGDISVTSDRMNIAAAISANAASSVTLKPKSLSRAVGLGSADSVSLLGLTDAELDFITAGTLQIGDTATATITVNSLISRTAATDMTLICSGDIHFIQGIATGGGLLNCDVSSGSGAIKPTFTGVEAYASTFGGAGNLTFNITGTTADTQYDQLTVAGAVQLTDLDLVLTGAFVPVAGNSFVLINNDGPDAVSGTFAGLAQNSTLTFNGVLMRISYTGGSGNDVVLSLANTAPTDIALNASSIAENAGTNATVGTLSTTDVDASDTHSYSIVTGAGDTDNLLFSIVGNALKLTASPDFEAKSTYNVRINTNDGTTNFEKAFTITVTNINEVPSFTKGSDQLHPANTIGAQVVSSWASGFNDGDSTVTQALTLNVSNDNNAIFSVQPSINLANGALTYTLNGTAGTATVSLSLTDDNSINGNPALTSVVQTFTIGIAAGPEITVTGNAISISNNDTTPNAADHTLFTAVAAAGIEETRRVFTIRNVGTADLTLSTVALSGAHADQFLVITQPGASLAPAAQVTFSVAFLPTSLGVKNATVSFATNDSDETPFTFAISGEGLNTPPTDIALSNAELPENNAANATVGTLSTTDDDSGQTFVYSLVSGAGSADNAQFTIAGNELKLTPSANFEDKAIYNVRINTSDGTANFEKAFVVTITNINEVPSFTKGGNQGLPPFTNTAQTVPNWATALSDGDGTGQSLTFVVTNDNNGLFTTQPAVSPTGELTYTPNGSAGSAIVSVSIRDDDSINQTKALTSAAQTFTITVSAGPEMDVRNGPVSIANGDTTPAVADSTDFGGHYTTLAASTRSFAIHNTGTGPLALSGTPVVAISGPQASEFTVTLQPAATLAAGQNSAFQIAFQPTTFGLRTATVTIANDDPDENPYTFTIQGTGLAPNIAVTGNSVAIVKGDTTPDLADHTDFGGVAAASGSIVRTFTIQNTGTSDLEISSVFTTGIHFANFTVTTEPTTPVAAGSSTTFAVTFNPSARGVRNTTVRIVTNDLDDSPFNFAITGDGMNSVPTDIALSPSSLAENNPASETVGFLSTTDADSSETFTYILVDGAASGDNGSFTIVGNELKLTQSADFEAKATYNIRVQTSDSFAATFDKAFVVTIDNVNEVPSFTKGPDRSHPVLFNTAQTVPNWATNINDGDSTVTQTLAFNVSNDNSGLFSSQPAISPASQLTYTTNGTAGSATVSVSLTDDASINDTAALTSAVQTFTITVAAGPEIAVTGNSVNIVNNVTTTNAADHTEFPAVVAAGTASSTRTFTVTNSGSANLSLINLSLSLTPSSVGQFSFTAPTSNVVAPGGNATFTATFSPSSRGVKTARINLQSDDADEQLFSFAISGEGLNSAPTDIPLSPASINENNASGATVGNLTSTDADAEDTTFTYTLVAGTGSDDNTSFQIRNGNEVAINLISDYETKTSYTIRVRTDDGDGGTFEKALVITINDINEAPTATPQAVATLKNVNLPITLTASDVENNPLSYTVVGSPSSGSLIGTAPNVTYRPNFNFVGNDSFTFSVNDGSQDSALATISISVGANNIAPTATGQLVSINEDTTQAIALTGSDVDDDPLTFTVLTAPTHGTYIAGIYTPASNYNGPDSFTFKANDGTVDSNIATISITVNPVNDVPVSQNIETATDEDTSLPITLTATDVENSPVTFRIVTGPQHGTLTGAAAKTYTPTADYNGPDSFTYVPNDGTADGAERTVSITVRPVNDAPTISGIANQGTAAGTATAALPFTIGDLETAATELTVTFTSSNQALVPNANVTLGGSAAARTVQLAPVAGQVGSTTIQLTVSDGSLTASTTFTLSVTGDPIIAVYNGPTATDPALVDGQSASVDFGTPFIGVTVTKDFLVKNNGPVSLSLADLTVPAGYSLVTPFAAQSLAPAGTYAFSIRFTPTVPTLPVGGLVHIASNDPSTAVFDFPIIGSGQAPTANITVAPAFVAEDGPTSLLFTVTRTGPTTAAQEVNYAISGTAAADTDYVFSGIQLNFDNTSCRVTIPAGQASATFSADPTPDASPEPDETIILTFSESPDGITAGTSPSATGVITNTSVPEISVTHQAAPVRELLDGTLIPVDFGSYRTPVVLSEDFRISNPGTADLIISGLTVPTGFVLESTPLFPVTLAPGGQLDFTIRAAILTKTTASGNVVIASNDADEASLDFPITATHLNATPIANNQSVTTAEATAKPITLTGSDLDEDALDFNIVTPPAHGSLTGTGANRIYTPTGNYNGPDSFTFNVNDGTADSNIATISITVTAENCAPTLVGTLPNVIQIKPGVTSDIPLTTFFSDDETPAANLIYTVTGSTGGAYFTSNLTAGTLSLTGTMPGQGNLTVRATDPQGLFAEATFTYTVKHVPTVVGAGFPDMRQLPTNIPACTGPVAVGEITVRMLDYFTDADADSLTTVLVTNSNPAAVATTSTTPNVLNLAPLAAGISDITIQATDSDGNTVTDTFRVQVGTDVPCITQSGLVLNRQTGLLEMRVTVTNTTGLPITGFRLTAPGLPAGSYLYNNTGPTGSHANYMTVASALANGASKTIVMEFYSPTRTLVAPAIQVQLLSVAGHVSGGGAPVAVSRINGLADGVLVEFSTTSGRTYQIEYSSNLTNWSICPITIKAGGNRVQWIDRGPPYTDVSPLTTPSRYYRVREFSPTN